VREGAVEAGVMESLRSNGSDNAAPESRESSKAVFVPASSSVGPLEDFALADSFAGFAAEAERSSFLPNTEPLDFELVREFDLPLSLLASTSKLSVDCRGHFSNPRVRQACLSAVTEIPRLAAAATSEYEDRLRIVSTVTSTDWTVRLTRLD